LPSQRSLTLIQLSVVRATSDRSSKVQVQVLQEHHSFGVGDLAARHPRQRILE
jgi:hypothetical protein